MNKTQGAGEAEKPRELAKYEQFYDTIVRLDDLSNRISYFLDWINGDKTSEVEKAEGKEKIKSVNALLENLESDLWTKYSRFEELLDELLKSLCIEPDMNLVRTEKELVDKEDKKHEMCVFNAEKIITSIYSFWNVYNTLQNIHTYLTYDKYEVDMLAQVEPDLKEFTKSVAGVLGMEEHLVDIIKMSEEKVENIRDVFI